MWLLLKEEVFSQEVSAVTASIVIFLEDYVLNVNPHQNGPSGPMQNGGVRSFPGPKQSRASPRQEDRTQSPHHRPYVTRALPEFPALLATPYLWLHLRDLALAFPKAGSFSLLKPPFQCPLPSQPNLNGQAHPNLKGSTVASSIFFPVL